VFLLLDVERVDLLFAEIDDLAPVLGHRGLAVALDGGRVDETFLGGLAAVQQEAEEALELHVHLFARLDVGVGVSDSEREQRNGYRRSGYQAFHSATSMGKRFIVHGLRFSAGSDAPRKRRERIFRAETASLTASYLLSSPPYGLVRAARRSSG